MGLVFVAEQQHPVRRKVALKLIKPGMGTRDVMARVEAVPWTENTITNVFSITKSMTSLAALVLVVCGEIDLDAEAE